MPFAIMSHMKKSLILIAALAGVMSVSAAVKRAAPKSEFRDDLDIQFELQRAALEVNADKWKEIKKLRKKLRPIYQAKYAELLKKTLFTDPKVTDSKEKAKDWLYVRSHLSALYLALYSPIGGPGEDIILEILRNEDFALTHVGIK